jgi:hypothetical protein
MRDNDSRFNASGRRSGNEPKPKPIKHTVKDSDRGVKFEVFASRPLTSEEVDAAVKKWLGDRKISDLTPWRTYRIQIDEDDA